MAHVVSKYGYRMLDGQVVPDPGEQEILKTIRELREEKEWSYGDIAGHLNATGVLNRGKYWSGGTVYYLYKRVKDEVDVSS